MHRFTHSALRLGRTHRLTTFAAVKVGIVLLCSSLVFAAEKNEDSGETSKVPPAFSVEEIDRLMQSMVFVQGGRFTMGSNEQGARPREQPEHQVTVASFYMGATEVTQSLFERVMGWNVSYFPCAQCPVNNISWMNIHAFLEKLNQATGKTFRLPTEAEWEFAAKGGVNSKGYRFSGSDSIGDVAWYAGNAEGKSHPVAQKQPNELGLYDMTGNLWEFCQDDMNQHLYSVSPRANPLFDTGKGIRAVSMKVTRGGGYEFDASELEVYRRDAASSNVRMPDIGFRIVMDAQ